MGRELINLQDKSICVAGGSSGIGRATALLLSRLGAKVVLVARREEQLAETLSMMEGAGHSYYVADLEKTNLLRELMEKIAKEQGKLAGLVYCAGVAEARPIKVLTPSYAEQMMRINFLSFCEMVRQFVRKGRYVEGAKIVGISSCASIRPSKGQTIYSASKAAMDAAVLVLAQELAGKGITINTIRPSHVKTDMFSEFYNSRDDIDEYLQKIQPLGVIEAEEIAGMVAYLLSSFAKHITGCHMDIEGGFLSRL